MRPSYGTIPCCYRVSSTLGKVRGVTLEELRTQEATIEREIGDKPDNSQLFSEVADGVTCNGYGDCVSLLREPDAANPHVRFDERGVETEAWRS